ncbi:MAG TPA: hypothetical protein VK363_03120 [Pyrinomonadaceae bacterium]|nr:hypothetical protein [Pyrinomonadaceae bacterium]
MASFFRTLFDEIIDALGGGYDKPQPPPLKADGPPPTEDITARQNFSQGVPVKDAAVCRICGFRPAKPEYSNEYCDAGCLQRAYEQDLADRMDAWHDQFQERFGDD